MKYNGIELKKFTSEKPIAFDPPKQMLVCDNEYENPIKIDVLAYLPSLKFPVITYEDKYVYCAEIPLLNPRRATNRELARWLAMGNGESLNINTNFVHHEYSYYKGDENEACNSTHFIRKWDDEEWHQPTVDYMGLE